MIPVAIGIGGKFWSAVAWGFIVFVLVRSIGGKFWSAMGWGFMITVVIVLARSIGGK